MKTYTNEELNNLVAQGNALGDVGLGSAEIRVCKHGKRVVDLGGWWHYPALDHHPDDWCGWGEAHTHRVFRCALVPQQELYR